MKKCITCLLEKDETDFYKGVNQCKSCLSKIKKERRLNKIQKDSNLISKVCRKCKLEGELKSFVKGDDVCKNCEKLRYVENKEKISDYKKRTRDKEKVAKYWKKYYEENKNKVKEYNKKYRGKEYRQERYKKNREKIIKDVINYKKRREKNDEIYKFRIKVKNIIRISFLKRNFKKNGTKTEKILGCSIEYFKLYLESKFEHWMNWNNRGLYNGEFNYGWDIDHIIPISEAKSEEEIIKLNHFTNLQPLCSKMNRDIKKNYLF